MYANNDSTQDGKEQAEQFSPVNLYLATVVTCLLQPCEGVASYPVTSMHVQPCTGTVAIMMSMYHMG